MNLVILQDCLRAGGTERQSVALSRFFHAAGQATTLLTFRPGGALAPPGGSVPHLSLQPRDLHLNGFAPGLIRTLRRTRPDLVLCMGYFANLYAGFVQARLPEVPVVGTLRTLHKTTRWLVRSLKSLPLVISNTQAGRRLLTERFRLAPERVIVIPNPLTLAPAAAPADRERERRRRGAADPTFVLLNVGQFRKEKGQADLIRLVADWNPAGDWQLWLVGDGPMLEPCRRLARGLPRVRFPGYAADPSPFYAGADAAVLASRTEALPNFLCEAQAWGLPAVAYDVGGVREAFAPGASGYAVPYGREGLFREALSRLARDLPHRAAMADAARVRAKGFDPGRLIQAYLDRFRALLSQNSGPGGGERTG